MKLNQYVQFWTEDGWAKDKAAKALMAIRLNNNNATGKGNAARRRLERLQDEAEARQFEQDWYESRMLSEADVDAMAGFYDR